LIAGKFMRFVAKMLQKEPLSKALDEPKTSDRPEPAAKLPGAGVS